MPSTVQEREQTRRVEGRAALSDLAAALLAYKGLKVSCMQPYNPVHRATDHRAIDWHPDRDDQPDRGDPGGWWVCDICHPAPPGHPLEMREAGA